LGLIRLEDLRQVDVGKRRIEKIEREKKNEIRKR